jgi:hypothetical protein
MLFMIDSMLLFQIINHVFNGLTTSSFFMGLDFYHLTSIVAKTIGQKNYSL